MKKKLLIIEDDSDIIELLKIVFRDSGHDVIFSQFDLGDDYIHVLHPDLILLDVRLKGSSRSGSQICTELKSNPETARLPVILCSGEYNIADIARSCNADTYLAKPYNIINLLFQVNKFLS
ncbi:response regulator [Dyadobacter psychrotolerans]|uniref:Response regulator n=1 Tax=Dyadobacter psychrotolerans TaxID=2541721 RepID=A0A4R5DYP7_9BACT|nr:response regulator [Dyadobacter psychrotolerans]TDE17281.1 response regulator [Dyadobacter psychrotolerans]